MTVGLAFERNRIRHPEATAVFGEQHLTHRDLDVRSNRVANMLLARGLTKGDRVAFLVANRCEVVEVLGGVAKAGLVYVGLNFRLGVVELEQVFENAEPSVVVTDTEHLAVVKPIAEAAGTPILDIDTPEWAEALSIAGDDDPPTLHEVRHDDDFCIVYTSGTTGRPKGVLFNHAMAIQHATVACLEYELDRNNRYLIQIPHNSSVNITIIPCLVVGAALGFSDSRNFDPVVFARTVEQEGVTHSFLVPTQLMRLLDQLPRVADQQLGGLVTLGYGSSPISPDRLRELVDRFGPIFNQLYGMAEIASIGTILRKDDHVAGLSGHPELLSSCGQPSFAVDVLVVDPTGNPVGPGERGEVVFAGPHVMKGYFRDPERTDRGPDRWLDAFGRCGRGERGWIHLRRRSYEESHHPRWAQHCSNRDRERAVPARGGSRGFGCGCA